MIKKKVIKGTLKIVVNLKKVKMRAQKKTMEKSLDI